MLIVDIVYVVMLVSHDFCSTRPHFGTLNMAVLHLDINNVNINPGVFTNRTVPSAEPLRRTKHNT